MSGLGPEEQDATCDICGYVTPAPPHAVLKMQDGSPVLVPSDQAVGDFVRETDQ